MESLPEMTFHLLRSKDDELAAPRTIKDRYSLERMETSIIVCLQSAVLDYG